ncbi:FeoA family protein [Methanohalobium evestigatum Z-7303]|uniref:FeoA family protein n=1 Tax=Methanohalobium evestigatum (strain ATCC BAA-1072 / DSM 3721 / NBRC 107634 / OCM 161 / Z-7303) TaxID=644295 RepID=D7E7R9_METEZ|nr:FeoA family protein [Methanohalobium evestigatum]ADI74142.1 FeoA family protein [Methanohalobium evestigatum Z-7303]
MNLSQVKSGETVRIVDIGGGYGIRNKLRLRGIDEGRTVRVLSTRCPVTIEVGRNTISIGCGMAQKVRVSRV